MSTKFVIVGLQRTGTTWIRTTLDSHPSIQALGEVFLYSHGRVSIWRTAGRGISQSYGDYIEGSTRRKFMHFANRRAIVEEYLDQLFTGKEFAAIGFKLMRTQAEQFPMVIPYLRKQEVRVIHVVRENVLKTHISRETAKHRRLYHAERDVPVRQITLDTKRLVRKLDRIARENFEWECIFAESPYLKVTYESFVKNKDKESGRLCSFLDVEPDQSTSSTLAKINPDAIQAVIANYSAVCCSLKDTPHEWCLTE